MMMPLDVKYNDITLVQHYGALGASDADVDEASDVKQL